jgi:hypothetical protein
MVSDAPDNIEVGSLNSCNGISPSLAANVAAMRDAADMVN